MELVERALSGVIRMMEVWESLREKIRILRRLKLCEVDHLFDGASGAEKNEGLFVGDLA